MKIVEHVSLLYVGASSAQEWYCWILQDYYVYVSEEFRNWFPEWLYQLAIQPAMEECFSFSTSLPTSAATWVFYLSHSDWCEVGFQGCLDFHFTDA